MSKSPFFKRAIFKSGRFTRACKRLVATLYIYYKQTNCIILFVTSTQKAKYVYSKDPNNIRQSGKMTKKINNRRERNNIRGKKIWTIKYKKNLFSPLHWSLPPGLSGNT